MKYENESEINLEDGARRICRGLTFIFHCIFLLSLKYIHFQLPNNGVFIKCQILSQRLCQKPTFISLLEGVESTGLHGPHIKEVPTDPKFSCFQAAQLCTAFSLKASSLIGFGHHNAMFTSDCQSYFRFDLP